MNLPRIIWVVFLGTLTLMQLGCPGGGGGPGGGPTSPTVQTRDVIATCDLLNGQKAKCNNAKDAAGSDCFYEDATNQCKAMVAQACSALDKAACAKRIDCKWDGAACIDNPVIAGDKKLFTLPAASLAAMVLDGSNKISAIGKSGDGAWIYFSAQDKKNKIAAYKVADSSVTSLETQNLAAGTGPGEARLGEATGNTEVAHIMAGPGDTAVVALKKVATVNGGVLEMKANTVRGSWAANNTDLTIGKDNVNIGALLVAHNNWIVFPASATPAHFKFGAPLASATPGPKIIGTPVTVSVAITNGNDWYVAITGGTVVKVTIANEAALNLDIDLSGATKVAEAKDFVIKSGMNNSLINAIAFADGYLLVGLSQGGPGTDRGGVALINLADNTKTTSAPGGWTVRNIAVSSDGKTAFVFADKGVLHFMKGKLTPIENGDMDGDLNLATIKAGSTIAFKGNRNAAKLDLTQIMGGVSVGNDWYFATDTQGIFKIDDQWVTSLP